MSCDGGPAQVLPMIALRGLIHMVASRALVAKRALVKVLLASAVAYSVVLNVN